MILGSKALIIRFLFSINSKPITTNIRKVSLWNILVILIPKELRIRNTETKTSYAQIRSMISEELQNAIGK